MDGKVKPRGQETFLLNHTVHDVLEISSVCLVQLNGLEERLKVPCAKALVIAALDQLDEHRGAVLQWFREDLRKHKLVRSTGAERS